MTSRLKRQSASVVVFSNGPHLYQCLDAVVDTIAADDQVLVIGCGSYELSKSVSEKYPSIQVVSDGNLSQPAMYNRASELATRELVVFLDSSVLVYEGWLDELAGHFSDSSVIAVGPRSNSGSKNQMIDMGCAVTDQFESYGEFAYAWRMAHCGQSSLASALDGFCVVIRYSLFGAVGGFDDCYQSIDFAFQDLFMKLREIEGQVLIANGCYLKSNPVDLDSDQSQSNQGGVSSDLSHFRSKWGCDQVPPVCLLSVCLIVKDEEQLLAGCLASVAEIADEIIVYDTGSQDSTKEIARSFGAKVIEGYWDESFARARNAALEKASGIWVLSLDADERLMGDLESVRARLSDRNSVVEAFLVSIENLHGAGNARSVHTAVRLFKRLAGTWKHRLHEQVVASDLSGRKLVVGYLSGARIIHHGYSSEIFDAKNKSERNLRIAEISLEDDDMNQSYALMNYGRALESAGRSDEATEILLQAAEIATDPITKRLAVKNLIYILARLGRFDESLEQVDHLRKISNTQIAADVAEGRVRISMGDIEQGLALLDKVPLLARDDEGMEYGTHILAGIKGEALASVGRFDEASQVVIEAIRSEGILEADLGELTLWVLKAGKSPKVIAEAMKVSDLKPILGRLLRQSPEIADVVLEGIWGRFNDRLEPLAAAARIAPKLPVARALVWSARLRRSGLSAQCPLVSIGRDENIDPRLRILACAAAFGSFGDREVVGSFRDALSGLDEGQKFQAIEEVGRIAPGLINAEPIEKSWPDPLLEDNNAVRANRDGSETVNMKRVEISKVPRRGGVNIVGSFTQRSTYGEVARTLARSLALEGVKVCTLNYGSDGISTSVDWHQFGTQNLPFDVNIMVLAPGQLANFTLDFGVEAFEGRYMVGYWCWDYDRPCDDMIIASKMLHEIWTPSSFSANAIRQITDRIVSRMLLPIDAPKLNEDFGDDFSMVTFMAHLDFAEGIERQNIYGLVEAYRAAFADEESARLVIGYRHGSKFADGLRVLAGSISDRKDIRIIDEDVTGEDSIFDALNSKFACLVSLCKSEGTGLYLSKAMGAGIPTISTDYSYSAELQSSKDSFLVPFVLSETISEGGFGAGGGRWAEPNLTDVTRFMKLVASQPMLAKLRATRAKERYNRQFLPLRAAGSIRNRLRSIEHSRHGESLTRT